MTNQKFKKKSTISNLNPFVGVFLLTHGLDPAMDTWAPRAVVLVGALLVMLAVVLQLALPKNHASRSAVIGSVLSLACVLFIGYCFYHQCLSEESDGGDAQYHTELTAEGGRV